MAAGRQHEGLKAARLLLVFSSISPLFILWAIRGNCLIPDVWFVGFCAAMVIIPNGFLGWRIRTARRLRETANIVVGRAEDHRDHLLVYLFAMLLPFYEAASSTWRDFVAILSALSFIIFLFWHANLHYMNLIFAVLGYRVFTVYPPEDGNPVTARGGRVIITQRTVLLPGDEFIAYRISNTVYLELNNDSRL